MMTLVMGGSGSGKSAWAEAYTVSLSSGKKYYLATMQVTDAESAGKAERHRCLRAGKGFVTIEQPRDIAQAAGRMTGEKREERTALLECMSNLTANEMFSGAVPAGAEQTAEKILRVTLHHKARSRPDILFFQKYGKTENGDFRHLRSVHRLLLRLHGAGRRHDDAVHPDLCTGL